MHPTPLALNDYADDALPAREMREIAGHLETCADCGTLVSELTRVKEAAASLGPIEPPAHVWSRIDEARSAGRLTPWRGSAAWPPAASLGPLATAAALFIVTIASVWFGSTRERSTAVPSTLTDGTGAPSDASLEAELGQVDARYQEAIQELENAAASQRDALDPTVAQTLRSTLAEMDQAIGESREALMLDPESGPAQASLLDDLQTKLLLLQDTITLINAARRSGEG